MQNHKKTERNEGQLSKNERIKLHNEKIKRQKRRRNACFIGVVVAAAVAVVTALSLFVFFRIDSIRIEGESRYSDEEIARASGIRDGDGVLLLNRADTEEKIITRLVYIGKVEVQKKLSGSVILKVSETTADYYAQTATVTVLFDPTGKVLEFPVASVPRGCTLVKGLQTNEIVPGHKVAQPNDESYALFREIARQCAAAGIGGITEIDLQDTYDINVIYSGKFIIKLGKTTDLGDKLLAAAEVIRKETDAGSSRATIIDVSAGSKAYVRNAEHTTAAPTEPLTLDNSGASGNGDSPVDRLPEGGDDDIPAAEG